MFHSLGATDAVVRYSSPILNHRGDAVLRLRPNYGDSIDESPIQTHRRGQQRVVRRDLLELPPQ